MSDLRQEQTYLLPVVNRPTGLLSDHDLKVRAQKEEGQSFLRGEALEQAQAHEGVHDLEKDEGCQHLFCRWPRFSPYCGDQKAMWPSDRALGVACATASTV